MNPSKIEGSSLSTEEEFWVVVTDENLLLRMNCSRVVPMSHGFSFRARMGTHEVFTFHFVLDVFVHSLKMYNLKVLHDHSLVR